MKERINLFDRNFNNVIESDLTEKDIRFIVADCELLNVNVYIFQGEEVSIEDDLLMEMYVKCKLPDYFGFNYNALEECLRDFSFSNAEGHFFIFRNHQIMKINYSYAYLVLIDILEKACEIWKKRGVLFKVLLS